VLTTAVVLTSALFALPLSNLELAEQAVGEACSSISDSVLASGIDSVRLEMSGDHPGNWLVEQCIKAEMDGSGLVVLSTGGPSARESQPAAPAAGAVALRVRPMELSVILGNTSRSWLVGPQKVERTVRCELYAELADSSGTVIGSVRSSASRSDRVPVSDLPELRGSSDQAWLTGGEPQASTGGLLEPLVVTGVVASLIYLFYSSRAE